MKKILAFVILLFCFSAAFAVNGAIINSSQIPKNLTFVTSANTYAYKDTYPNEDLGLLLCDAGYRWVGATYAINKSDGWLYILISQKGGNADSPLVNTSNNIGNCYYTNIDTLIFSSSHLSSSVPEAFVAAFPGRIHILYSNNQDGYGANFVPVNFVNGSLLGSYSISSAFDQNSRNVNVTINSITFNSDVGVITKLPNDANYGINNNRRLIIGICTDDIGDDCSDGKILNSSSFPVSLSTGLSANEVNDQHTYSRYVVVNGLGYPFSIGANLKASITADNPKPRDGDLINLTVTISNAGNVNVTTDFNVTIYDNGNIIDARTITDNITPSGSVTFVVPYNTSWKTGPHTITAWADSSNNVTETNEDDNNDTITVNVTVSYFLKTLINGTESETFYEVGKPYNVTFNVTDSLNQSVGNATIRIIEKNGLNLFAPIQMWNESSENKGVVSYSIAEVKTNSSGLASLALIPVGNKLYDVYKDVDLHIGNYSLYAELYVNGELQKTVKYNVTNLTAGTPDGSINILNKENVRYVYDLIYQIIGNVWKWLGKQL